MSCASQPYGATKICLCEFIGANPSGPHNATQARVRIWPRSLLGSICCTDSPTQTNFHSPLLPPSPTSCTDLPRLAQTYLLRAQEKVAFYLALLGQSTSTYWPNLLPCTRKCALWHIKGLVTACKQFRIALPAWLWALAPSPWSYGSDRLNHYKGGKRRLKSVGCYCPLSYFCILLPTQALFSE